MSYAIIQLQGKQYKVSPGDTLVIDHLEAEKTVEIADVLLQATDKGIQVGTPTVKDAVVKAEVVSHDRGKKLLVFKYKSKSRYRRTKGHRQEQTTLKIVSV